MTLAIHGQSTGPFAENTYIAIDEGSGAAAVIDPGVGALEIWQRFAVEGATLERVLLTHAHLDHIFGLRELIDAAPAPIYLHRDDAFLIENYVEIAAEWGFEVVAPPQPTNWWSHGDRFLLGATPIEVRHTPGHSPGSVVLVFPGGVFSGDTLMGYSVGRTDFPGSSSETLVKSIRTQLYTLDDSLVVYPGHMQSTTIGEEKLHNQFIRGDD